MYSNTPEDRGQHIKDLRDGIEHRATWFYYMFTEAKKRVWTVNLPMMPLRNAAASMVRKQIYKDQ